MSPRSHKIVNAILYQGGWFACMLSSHLLIGILITVVMLVLHLWQADAMGRETCFITLCASLGYGIDYVFHLTNNLNLCLNTNNSFYLFIIWILFITTLRSSLSFTLNKKRYALSLGLLAPLAYLIGQNLGRVHYTGLSSILLHTFSWGALMIFIYTLKHKIVPCHEKF